MSVRAFSQCGIILVSLGLSLASCAGTPSSKSIAHEIPRVVPDASAVPVAEHEGVIAADTPSASPIAPAPTPTFDALLPPLPASSSRSWSQLAPPAQPPPKCTADQGWDGTACVTTTCVEGSRFAVGRGCGRCADFGCAPNPERRPWGNEITPFDRDAARAALESVRLSTCKRDGGPVGQGIAMVTFHPAGGVYYVELLEGPFTRTLVGGCIVTQFESVRVPKFGGSVQILSRVFSLY